MDSKKYVTDIIGEEYKSWQDKDRIIIANQTGSGKTHFVINTLLPYAAKNGKHVLYICNRRVLEKQSLKNFKKMLLSQYGDDADNYMRYIHIRTYQRCEATGECPYIHDENNFETTIRCCDIMYYIFDEAHYFLSDASFNKNIVKWTNINISGGISVYLTATPEPLLYFLYNKFYEGSFMAGAEWYFKYSNELYEKARAYIKTLAFYEPYNDELRKISELLHKSIRDIKKEYNGYLPLYLKDTEYDYENKKTAQSVIVKYLREVCGFTQYKEFFSQLENSFSAAGQFCKLYPSDNYSVNYDYIVPHYFKNNDDIIKKIQTCDNEEKWLIFQSDLNTAKELYDTLFQSGIDVHFISAERISKKEEKGIFLDLVENECFNCQVLITTSVLDCGINIKDPSLKNIVIETFDKTSFLQMLGRIRINDYSTMINLYIYEFSTRTLNGHKHMLEEKLKTGVLFCLHNKYEKYKSLGGTEYKGIHFLSDAEIKNLSYPVNKSRSTYYCIQRHIRPIRYDPTEDPLFFKVQLNTQAALNDLYLLYNLDIAFSKRKVCTITQEGKKPKIITDDHFFLKYQLSWLGKEYDEKCWIDYSNDTTELIDLLESNLNCELEREQHLAFSHKCIELLYRLPNIMPQMKANKKRFLDPTSAAKKTLNAAFAFHNLNYNIESYYKTNPSTKKREAFWVVRRT